MACISNINTLKSIYYAYFRSVIKYGIFFLVNSSNNGKIFTLQKKIVRIMAVAQTRTSDGSLFKQIENLTVPCQYILPLMNFTIKIRKFYKQNKHCLHRPNAILVCFLTNMFSAGKNFEQFAT
jgi:glucan phosphoethanolaminetransferase (alkaline phosphatase superfamily)